MKYSLVSVVIPAYNQAEYLGGAIQSVLNQTYQNFEIIVINDASTDNTDQVIKQFDDPRLKYIVHDENQRLSAARNTGIKASTGEIIFLLDADDLFHPEKLQAHVELLEKHPEIGASYNARFELNHSSSTIREMWRPPQTVSLKDMVLTFPFSPSDMVVRREWSFKVGLFDPEIGTAEDTDFPCRLALEGCQFAGIDRALNYRSYHSGVGRKNLPGRIHDVKCVQDAIFADPRCPDDVRTMGRMAIRHHLMVIVSLALIQNETNLAQKYVRELMELDPTVIEGEPCELVAFLLSECIADDSVNHEVLLKQVFAQLPQELAWLSSQYNWAVARGYLWKGVRAIMWGREDDGKAYLSRANGAHARIDDSLMQHTTYHLLGYEKEFGADAVNVILKKLSSGLSQFGFRRAGRSLEGCYWVNRAFDHYRTREFSSVPREVIKATMKNFSFLTNRGVISIFLRSIVKAVR